MATDTDDTDDGGESLRERKKARTRASLIRVSQRLFAERGYHATTLEEICLEVEVRPQTLLRYFDSKAHLAMAPWSDQLRVIRHLLESPERSATTVEVWRSLVRAEAIEAMEPSSTLVGYMITNHLAFTAWADKDPTLVAMNSNLERQCEAILAEALAVDVGAEPGDLHCTLLAAMLVVGRRAVFDRWCAPGGRGPDLVEDQLAVIAYAVASLPRDVAAGRLPDGPRRAKV